MKLTLKTLSLLLLPVLLGAGFTLLTKAPAAGPLLSFTRVPLEVVRGHSVAVEVTYDVSSLQGQVPLHVELKTPGAIVLATQTLLVKGKGHARFTFTVPDKVDLDEVRFACWLGNDWRSAPGGVVNSPAAEVLSEVEAKERRSDAEAARKWAAVHSKQLASGPVLAVLMTNEPEIESTWQVRLVEYLRRNGLDFIVLAPDEAANASILSTEHFWGLLLTNSEVFPAVVDYAFSKFCRSGGDVMVLNAPLAQQLLFKAGKDWLTDEAIQAEISHQRPERMILDFEQERLVSWESSSDGHTRARWEIVSGGANGTSHCLQLTASDFSGWATSVRRNLQGAFAPDKQLTCFWAKGDKHTTSMVIEWDEADGSRWIATVPLTTKWQYYVLEPEAFKFWSSGSPANRGKGGDCFHPERAVALSVGLALTHNRLSGPDHRIWVDEIGVAHNPLSGLVQRHQARLPKLDEVYPPYKFFPVTSAVKLRTSPKQVLLPSLELPVKPGLQSVQPRPQATGFGKHRKWRWIPLLEAFDEKGEVCGTPACLILHEHDGFAGCLSATFALPEAYYSRADVQDLVLKTLQRMHSGYFLREGGSQYYAYFQHEKPTLGASILKVGNAEDAALEVKLQVKSASGVEFERTLPAQAAAEGVEWDPGTFKHRDYTITCILQTAGGEVLDRLQHPLVVWEPPAKPEFMQIRGGHFFLAGKPWYPHGVNYMPSSEIGIEDGEYFEFWLDPQPYDPVVTQRDLEHIKAIGMNMVSVFCYYRSLESRNLLDLLERCRRLDLKVNLSLRPGTPMNFRWSEMKALIEAYRLPENDTVFAYDLAWEPVFGNHERRKVWDGDWAKWIVERYGSLANAEADWGVPVPRENGKITNPSDTQCSTEGKHRVMVCAYRRFLDDLLAKKHAEANGLVKSIDPHHFTSFRMNVSGDPTVSPSWIAYDFKGLARSVDIMEPEGYGRTGDWDRVKAGRFTIDYARCMAPDRPVMWAEFGCSSWDNHTGAPDHSKEKWVGDFYDEFCRMTYEGGGDGTVCWYYPGGFRVGENSDYGIINCDGTWRPNTRAIALWAPKFEKPHPDRPVDEWITIDRDATVGGIVGVYNLVKDCYWQIIAEGKRPGLRRDGEGLTSKTAPPVAVGNVSYKPGRNPHKYLDAEFDYVKVRNARGEWQTLRDGSTVEVHRGQPVLVKAQIGNIGDATWIAGEGEGTVWLTCGEALAPIPADCPFCGTARIEDFQVLLANEDMPLVFQMEAWPDTPFGEKIEAHLKVIP